MRKAGGIVIHVAADRRTPLLEAFNMFGRVAEVVPEFTLSRNVPLIAFLCFADDKVTHLARARRGMRAGHELSRLNLYDMTELPASIEVPAIAEAVPLRIRRHAEARLSNGGLLSPTSFTAVVDAVRGLSEASRPLLDRFSATRQRRVSGLGAEVRRGLAFQKESVATALALAGLERDELQAWEPPDEGTASVSFLDGLPSVRLREDPMVIHDMTQVPDFEQVRAMPFGAAVFEGPAGRLTVVLANRLPLEQQLGADLIYFNETYKAFVIVQYKAMESDRAGRAVFRIPDAQLTDEIKRMDVTLAALQLCPPDAARLGFRLHDNPFFLKLCPRIVFNPDDKGLSRGMYIPLEYWRLLEADDALKGPQGGRRLTYENVGRYLDNTGFVNLVAHGWVGTTTEQSAVLEEVIREVISSGRTVTIAVKTVIAPIAAVADEPDGEDDRGLSDLFGVVT